MDSSGDSKCAMIPQRVILGVMSFFGIVVAFLMRACLSVAITEMVIPANSTSINNNETLICPANSLSVESSSESKTNGMRYNWTQEQQGWILSSFFIGYVITHVPGAILAQRFGGKWTMALGILATTICSAATPFVTENGGYMALIIIRVLMGLAGGMLFPALSVLLAAWVPEKERGKLAVFVLGGGQIGSLVSFYVSGLILAHWSWPIVFYFWSAVSFVWFIIFIILCYNDPASHPFISKKELEYLKVELGQLKRNNNLPSTPWKQILTSAPIIILIFAQVGNDFVFYVLASDLPKYMREVLGFSVRDVGLYSSMPYFLMWIVSLFSGFVCDHLISKRYVTVTQARKLFAALGSVFPAIFIVAASYAGCNKSLVVVWFTLGMGFMGNYYPGLRVNLLDLSPNYCGSIMALSNGIAAIAGVVAPTFVGMMTPDSTLEQWRFVFWVAFGVSMSRTVIYSIWASAKVQPWDKPEQYKSHESHKLTESTESDKTMEVYN